MGNLAGRLAKLEQKTTPRPFDVTVVLNFHDEQERAKAEAEYRQYPEGVVKRVYRLTEAGA